MRQTLRGAGTTQRAGRWIAWALVAGMIHAGAALARPPARGGGERPAARRRHDPLQRKPADRKAGSQKRPQHPPARRARPHDRRRDALRHDNPFRPAPQDLGPLREGEADRLLQFARHRMPRVYEALQRLRETNPQGFQRRLADLAPRLRQLRRLYEQDPALGDLLVEHVRNVERLNRIRMFVARNRNRPEALRRAAAEARRAIVALRRIEIDVLTRRIEQLRRDRDAQIEEMLGRLTDPDAELLAEPPEIRRIVGRLRRAANDRERAAIEQQLRRICEHRIDERIAALRERIGRMRRNAAVEIDRRVQRFIEDARKSRVRDVP